MVAGSFAGQLQRPLALIRTVDPHYDTLPLRHETLLVIDSPRYSRPTRSSLLPYRVEPQHNTQHQHHRLPSARAVPTRTAAAPGDASSGAAPAASSASSRRGSLRRFPLHSGQGTINVNTGHRFAFVAYPMQQS